ncbi:MAG: spore protease YyaC [Bacillota bacterium]
MTVYRIASTDSDAPQRIAESLRRVLGCPEVPLTVVCIGSDRSTGDSLGPLVGSMLLRSKQDGVFRVMGTLDQPVHAANLQHWMQEVGPRTPVLALDACLGAPSQVGMVSVGPGPLRPGAGLHKMLPPIGDAFITGTVNVAGFADFLVLQTTRLSFVVRMARAIAAGICGWLGVSWDCTNQFP